MRQGQSAAFGALFAGLLLVSHAGTTAAFRIPGCPHRSKGAVGHSGPALTHEDTAFEQSWGRALLQDGGGDGGGSKPSGVAGWSRRVHGYTASISLGIVMPFAAIIARGFREYAPTWFWIHAPLSVAAFIGGIVGVVFGSQLPADDFEGSSIYSVHKAVGGVALGLAGFQVVAAILRPKPTHRRRYLFNHIHHWAGRLAIVLTIVAIYLGLRVSVEYHNETTKFYWGYGIVLAALALLWLGKEAIDFFRVTADNKRVDRAGFEASRLPGGVPMNGNFAPVLLQRRPKDAGLPIDGHGVPPASKGYDEQAAMAATNGYASNGAQPFANGVSGNGHTTGLLHPGAATNGAGATNGYSSNTTGHLHQGGGAPGGVEMARY